MTVIIFGEADDVHAQAVASHLNDYVLIDYEAIQNNITITSNICGDSLLYFDDELLTPTSVYWRTIYFDSFGEDEEQYQNSIAFMQLFFNAFPNVTWLNKPSAFAEHFTKIHQLKKVTSIKPATLFTNNADDAYAFASNYDRIALKPIGGGAYIEKYTADKLLNYEFTQPVCLQEFIEGTNMRTFIVGDNIYTAAIDTDADDWRTADFTYTAVDLADYLEDQAFHIAHVLGYTWTAIDWIFSNDRLYFLEANFSPMWLYFEEQTDYPITKNIANLLI